MTEALCDMCGKPGDPPPDPATWWVYPCRDFVHAVEIAPNAKTGELSALDHGSEGEWLACPACAALVEQGPSAIPAMVARMLRRADDKSPEAQRLYAIGLTSMYAMFFDSRDGTPRHLLVEESEEKRKLDVLRAARGLEMNEANYERAFGRPAPKD